MIYILIKTLHILSATFLFGTGVGSAFYLLCASLQRDPRIVAFVARYVVIADWLFTATTVIAQPITGYYLLKISGLPLQQRWLMWSIALYVVAVACWIPVVFLQMRMRDIAQSAAANEAALPIQYWRYFYTWVALGFPALFAFIAIFYLMVAKPF